MTTRALLADIARQAEPARDRKWRAQGFIPKAPSRWTLALRILGHVARHPAILLALVASLFHRAPEVRTFGGDGVHVSVGLGTLASAWRWLRRKR